MLGAFIKAIDQINEPATRRIVWLSLGIAVVVFAGLWAVVATLLISTTFFTMGWLETAADVLGGLATIIITWLLFPAFISAVIAFFLENIAQAVEDRHYPGLPAPRTVSLAETLVPTARFLGLMIFLNLLMLPIILIPPVFPFVFYSVNGYLLSREYFDLVAMRRMPTGGIRALRKAHRVQLFGAGVVIAFLLTVPVVNLLAPIIAIGVMVHLFQAWRPERERERERE